MTRHGLSPKDITNVHLAQHKASFFPSLRLLRVLPDTMTFASSSFLRIPAHMPPATPSPAPPPLGSSSPIAVTVQLPSLPQEPYTLHPLLELSPSPAIQWDVRTSPLTIQMAYHSSRSQSQRRSAAWTPNACFAQWWHEPATSPPVQSLTVRVEGCQENIIFVRPGHSGTQFVTILDVVSCVSGAPRCATAAAPFAVPPWVGARATTKLGSCHNSPKEASFLA
ncbi:hypothetical protein DFP72DRAFT_225031 [Ephemerocybe angulata]|uniref:DUF6699 domain-containing protein n=1 Tax=Ephemerocybe angulata TaxID=980116 RepID=A0A8H6I5M4_9AGAR|nr:hypothetical protein DFP72DRAFT_225031 [Tulosesus angulatus]